MSDGRTRLVEIVLDTPSPPATPELDQEQRVAVFEIVEEHVFDVKGLPGDAILRLKPEVRSIAFTVEPRDDDCEKAIRFDLETAPFTSTIRDYRAICAAYFDAVRRLPVSRIEAIDEGRRAIHNTAGAQLVEALAPHATLDAATGRRLFSLIATLD